MLDALGPLARALRQHRDVALTLDGRLRAALAAAVQAVQRGAAATADMAPVAGRSCWVAPEVARGVQDPGAAAAAVWVVAVARALESMLGPQEDSPGALLAGALLAGV